MGIETVIAEPGQILDLGSGASLRVLTISERGAIPLLEWDHFRALLPLGTDPESQEILQMDEAVGNVNVLLLADQGCGAQLIRVMWVESER
jgi:hypothetical protein